MTTIKSAEAEAMPEPVTLADIEDPIAQIEGLKDLLMGLGHNPAFTEAAIYSFARALDAQIGEARRIFGVLMAECRAEMLATEKVARATVKDGRLD